jgi:predicted nucleic acid-binding protein
MAITGKKCYLLDTNVIIYYLQGYYEVEAVFADIESGIAEGKISVITKIEALAFPGLTYKEEGRVKQFLMNFEVVELTDGVIERAIGLRKQYKVRLPDALVAATAMEKEAVLITRNVKNFEKIGGLQVENPFGEEP